MKKRTKVLFIASMIFLSTAVFADSESVESSKAIAYTNQGNVVHYDNKRGSIQRDIVHYDNRENNLANETKATKNFKGRK